MNPKRFLLASALVLLLFSPLAGCTPSTFKKSDCQFDAPSNIPIECGFLSVPEDRSQEDSPMIQLHVAIVRTQNPHPAPDPIIILHGGPGGYALDNMEYWLYLFNFARSDRDLIVLDQRGVGYSIPSLNCPEAEEQWYQDWTQDLSMEISDQHYDEALQACHDRLAAEGINLSAYTSAANAADVEDLRAALGYAEWNLYGSSYGTRLALTIMRDHPEGVRSAILDSVYPPQVDLFSSIAVNFERSLDLVFERCTSDPDCNQTYPALETTFYELVDQLDREPLSFTLSRSSTTDLYPVLLNGDRLIWAVFQMLYMTDQIANLPWWITSIKAGTASAFPEILQWLIFSDDSLSEGMYYSIECNEETPFGSIEDIESSNKNVNPRLVDVFNLEQIHQICSGWDAKQPTLLENQAVSSDIPTLILSGEFDPITPPAWGLLTAESLSNSQFFEFPGFGHGILGSGTDRGNCSIHVVDAFLTDPSQPVEAGCISNFELSFRKK
jgi:pimeloyl-ACP methyl ester carboxylesterase